MRVTFSLRPVLAAMRGAFVVLVLGLLAACSGGGPAGDARLVLHTAQGDYTFTVEIADTGETRAQGLMFRTELAPDAGMLFDYHQEQMASFWMQNTLIPLDMIFISADGIVRSFHVNARPLDTTSILSGVPVQFVLEIPGGRAREIGLAVGDRVEHVRMGTGG